MKRTAFVLGLVVAAALIADPAQADVASTMQTASQNMKTWVQAGGLIVIMACGIALIRGFQSLWFFGGALIGLAVAIQPELIMGWIT